MRCNKHVSDLSSSIGVCASCLRERLFVLIAAQVEENRRKGEERHQPPLVFPRSVSPYICRRSDDSSWHSNDRRFYSTPQVGPTFSFGSSKKKKSSSSLLHTSSNKFSIFSTLFRSSRSEVSVSDLSSTDSKITSSSPSSSSSSWFSNLMPSRRKKHSRFAPPPVCHHRRKEKGMSPANVEDDRNYDAAEDGSPLESGYSSESYQGARKSAAAPVRRRGSAMHSRNVSGLAFCLSPLVRASPNSHRNQKDANLQPMGFSGEIARKPAKVTLSTAASLCANRSRKLADFGREDWDTEF